MSSVEQQQKELSDDLQTLLEYAQALRAETDSLKSILRGSVIFLRNNDKEKIFKAVAGAEIAFPQLKTLRDGWRQSFKGKEPESTGASVMITTEESANTSLPVITGNHLASSSDCEAPTPSLSSHTEGVGHTVEDVAAMKQGSEGEGGFGEPEMPVLHTISDLEDFLLEYNKLKGRLLQFTSNNIIASSTTIPNIGDHNLKDVRVIDIRDNQGTSEFVMHATWTNGQCFEIYRRYLDFFTFQATLRGLNSWKQRRKLSAEPFPELPLSDHLLVVLGQLNTVADLQQRTQLVETFFKTAVAEVAGRIGGDIYRTSVLVFFACKPCDVEIQSNTAQEADFSFPPEEDEDDIENCLGFLSSVAQTNDAQWRHVNSDVPKPKETKDILSLRFNKPSSAHPLLTQMHSAPGVTTHPQDIPKPKALVLAQVVSKLSILKSGHLGEELTREKKVGSLPSQKEFRNRSHNSKSEDALLARKKARSIKSGSTDWGVRNTLPDQNSSTDNATRQLNAV